MLPDIILPDARARRLTMLRNSAIDLQIALADIAANVSTQLEDAATLRAHLRQVRREIRALEIADLAASLSLPSPESERSGADVG